MFAPVDSKSTAAGILPMMSRCFLRHCSMPRWCPSAHSRAGLLTPRVPERDLSTALTLGLVGGRHLHALAAAQGVEKVSNSKAAATSRGRLPLQSSQEGSTDDFYAPDNATFASLGIDSAVAAALAAAGYSRPSNVQVANPESLRVRSPPR